MLARVSHVEAFRRWREDEESSVEDLVRQITVDEPSEAMLAGTAFHRALEWAEFGEHARLEANGYTFQLASGILELPNIREMRAYKRYGDLTVTGQVDGLHGGIVIDHKTTRKADPERYLLGAQWKFYLDLFEANTFRWHLFEIKEMAPQEYWVEAPQILTAHRYPEMPDYCAVLASDFLAFAREHLPRQREAA